MENPEESFGMNFGILCGGYIPYGVAPGFAVATSMRFSVVMSTLAQMTDQQLICLCSEIACRLVAYRILVSPALSTHGTIDNREMILSVFGLIELLQTLP
jgi:hypothetical protein